MPSDLPQHAAHPGYVDPYYKDKSWVQGWVTEPGVWAETLIIPEMSSPSSKWLLDKELEPQVSFREIIMHRYRCWGPVPYVGDPFHYEWWVGVDDYGRQVASKEVRIVYEPYPYNWIG